jgi:hypothetical protein
MLREVFIVSLLLWYGEGLMVREGVLYCDITVVTWWGLIVREVFIVSLLLWHDQGLLVREGVLYCVITVVTWPGPHGQGGSSLLCHYCCDMTRASWSGREFFIVTLLLWHERGIGFCSLNIRITQVISLTTSRRTEEKWHAYSRHILEYMRNTHCTERQKGRVFLHYHIMASQIVQNAYLQGIMPG